MITLPVKMQQALQPQAPSQFVSFASYVRQLGGKWPGLIYPDPPKQKPGQPHADRVSRAPLQKSKPRRRR